MSKFLALSALLGTAILSVPTAARAQSASDDSAYLNDLYSFLRSQDSLTYQIAAQELGGEYNVWAAQMFCQTLAAGVSPEQAFSAFSNAAMAEAANYGSVPDEVNYAIGLYGGTVMNLGAAYYCPQYQLRVEQALRSL